MLSLELMNSFDTTLFIAFHTNSMEGLRGKGSLFVSPRRETRRYIGIMTTGKTSRHGDRDWGGFATG